MVSDEYHTSTAKLDEYDRMTDSSRTGVGNPRGRDPRPEVMGHVRYPFVWGDEDSITL